LTWCPQGASPKVCVLGETEPSGHEVTPTESFLGDFQVELWTHELVASPPTLETIRLQLTLTGSAPRSGHRRSPSATSPLGPGGAGRISWSLGYLDMLTTAGTGNAGPSGAPPATRKANLISWNPWAALTSCTGGLMEDKRGFSRFNSGGKEENPFLVL